MLFSNILGEIFFPRRCLNCDARGISGAVCDPCFKSIPVNDTLFCGECRARLAEGKKICHPACPYLLGAASGYENPTVRALIHDLKFKRDRRAAEALGLLLSRYAAHLHLDLSSFAVIPVPLSKRRERERGFNQAELIAEAFMKTVPKTLPSAPLSESQRLSESGAEGSVFGTTLIRTRYAPPQSQAKDARERHHNVHGAFAVNRSENEVQKTLPARNIILIDDVTTSGATFHEAARALKDAGARHIVAFAAAKA